MSFDPAQAKSLFLAASDIVDQAERAAFLDRECEGNEELRARVQALLRANDASPVAPVTPVSATNASEGPALSLKETDYHDTTAGVGSVLSGKYKLVEEIGAGGMGSVFMAQQTEPVSRTVAVKIVKAGMDSKEVLARFEAERQALALMDHPNIAKVLDAGTTEGGRPFFVMELVRGVPITQFCDKRNLTPRQRLELFVPVCQAIQHAHQKAIIHRDIKPSNVLVALYDDRAVPKVIDFGVAKATGHVLTEKSLMTGFGAVVGTPEYMSPEQAQLNNLDVDARSDVYSLGVLLYELLTGTTPVDRKNLNKAALLEILRIVREEEPARPSAKLSTIETLASVAACRGLEPRRLSKLLAGELDWVVMKALEKDRTRRYETANGMGRDIQRYLADELVEARPPSTSYRLQKFVRKNKGQVLAASVVLLAVLAAIAGTTSGLIRAERERRIADAKREEAEEQGRRAEAGEKLARERLIQVEAEKKIADEEKAIAAAIDDFLQLKLLAQADLREQANAILQAGGSAAEAKSNPTIGELLDRAAAELTDANINENFPNQPRLQAEILSRVGITYYGIGSAEQAIGFFERAFTLFEQHLGAEHPDTLAAMGNLALAYQTTGQWDEAFSLSEETLELCQDNLGIGHIDTLTVMGNLAYAYEQAGDSEKALKLYEETLELRREHLGFDHLNTLIGMSNLASSYANAGQWDSALPLYQRALELFRITFGDEHPETLTCLVATANAQMESGELNIALPTLEQVLELQRERYGTESLRTLSAMSTLAKAYHLAGQLDKAVPLGEETLELLRAKLGSDRFETLTTMGLLSELYRANNELDKALALLEEKFERQKATLDLDDPSMSLTIGNLLVLYRESGQVEKGLLILEETVDHLSTNLGPEHPNTLSAMSNLVGAYADAGELEKAMTLADETLALARTELEPDHPGMYSVLHGLAVVYWRMGQLDKSIPLLEELLDITEQKMGRRHSDTLRIVADLGVNYKDADRISDALPLLEEAYQASKTEPHLYWIADVLLDAYERNGQFDKSLPLAEESFAFRRAYLGLEHPDTLILLNRLAVSYWRMGQLNKSIPLFEELLRIHEEKYGRQHEETLRSVANLGVNYKDDGRIAEALPLLEEAYEASKTIPALRWVGLLLLDGYDKAGQLDKALPLANEQLALARQALPPDSPQLAAQLAQCGLFNLKAKAYADAESIVRECLAIREETEPDAWTTFNTQSMLGGALLGQEKYTEAEPLLLSGYEGLKQREETIPEPGKPRILEALDRLIELYTATDKPAEVERLQAERATYAPAAASATENRPQP